MNEDRATLTTLLASEGYDLVTSGEGLEARHAERFNLMVRFNAQGATFRVFFRCEPHATASSLHALCNTLNATATACRFFTRANGGDFVMEGWQPFPCHEPSLRTFLSAWNHDSVLFKKSEDARSLLC